MGVIMFRIHELRIAAGLTQRELAEKIGVKNYTIANWEQNRTEPSVKDLIDLANYFECSVDYLIGRENDFGQIIVFKNGEKEYADLLCLYNSLSKERKQLVQSILKDLKALTDMEKN